MRWYGFRREAPKILGDALRGPNFLGGLMGGGGPPPPEVFKKSLPRTYTARLEKADNSHDMHLLIFEFCETAEHLTAPNLRRSNGTPFY